jgi:hypothetical protein
VIDHDHISDLRWDRMFAGELSAVERDAARAHADGCTRCGARMRELDAERAAFALRPPMPGLARKKRAWTWIAPFAGALAAAAVLVIVLVRRPVAEEAGERTKGGAKAKLHLDGGRAGALRPLATGDRVRPGDYLQAGYTSATDGFGAVLSVDGAGQANAYVPSRGDALIALPAGTERSFPESTELDDVLGTERIAVIWCEASQPLAPLLTELRTTGTLAERSGCAIRVVAVDKEK